MRDPGVSERDEVLDAWTAPASLSESTVACPSGPVCGSIATTGIDELDSAVLGVTTIAPSMSVPDNRERDRRSQPFCSAPVTRPAYASSS